MTTSRVPIQKQRILCLFKGLNGGNQVEIVDSIFLFLPLFYWTWQKKWRNSTRTKVKFSFKMVDYKTIDEQFQHMIDKSIFFSVPLICNLICFLSFYQNLNRVLIGRLRKVELKCKSKLRLCFNFWFFFSSLSLFFGWSGVTILSQIQFCRQSHREASDTAIIIKSDFAAANSDGDHLRFLQFSKTYVYPPNKIPQFLAQQSQQKKPSVSYEILSNSNMKQNFFTSSKKKNLRTST